MATRELEILRRASFRCEYCRTPLEGAYEFDHIVPRSQGGETRYENLAATCSRCNRNKGAATQSIDPLGGQSFTLFNPRRDNWIEHFRPLAHYAVGITPLGRASANLLFRQTRRQISSAPIPLILGTPISDSISVEEMQHYYGLRKAGATDLLLAHARPIAVERAILDAKSGVGSDEAAQAYGLELAAILAEALTSRSTIEDLRTAESLCSVAIDFIHNFPLDHPFRVRQPFFNEKRLLAAHQLSTAAVLNRSALGARPRRGRLLDLADVSRRAYLGTASAYRLEGSAGAVTTIPGGIERLALTADLAVIDGAIASGRAPDLEQAASKAEALLARSGFGQDADILLPVIIQRRTLITSLAVGAEMPTNISEHLRLWVRWGGLHQLRSLARDLSSSHRLSSQGWEVLHLAYSAIAESGQSVLRS